MSSHSKFTFNFKKIKQDVAKLFQMLQQRPEMAISLVAVVLLLVGVFSAVLLSGVEQDIRQQARIIEYVQEEPLTVKDVEGEVTVHAAQRVCEKETCKFWKVGVK
jgi:hypothetical protein